MHLRSRQVRGRRITGSCHVRDLRHGDVELGNVGKERGRDGGAACDVLDEIRYDVGRYCDIRAEGILEVNFEVTGGGV